jgi:hypothetical protein
MFCDLSRCRLTCNVSVDHDNMTVLCKMSYKLKRHLVNFFFPFCSTHHWKPKKPQNAILQSSASLHLVLSAPFDGLKSPGPECVDWLVRSPKSSWPTRKVALHFNVEVAISLPHRVKCNHEYAAARQSEIQRCRSNLSQASTGDESTFPQETLTTICTIINYGALSALLLMIPR